MTMAARAHQSYRRSFNLKFNSRKTNIRWSDRSTVSISVSFPYPDEEDVKVCEPPAVV